MNERDFYKKDFGLKDLHDRMFEILKYVHYFCQENKIDYCLAYGSALGAIRHKGFIPWDDDADIYMTVEGYRRFRELFWKVGDKEKFYLQELDAIDGLLSMAKLRMNETAFIEPLFKDYDMHQGIYIDIFILYDAPLNRYQRYFMNMARQYLVLKGLSNRRYCRKKLFIPILALMRLFPYNFLRKNALMLLHKYENKDAEEVFDPDLRKYKKSFYRKDLIFPARRAEFITEKLFVPAKAEEYLKWVYGDYMAFPEIESIQKAQHAIIWNVNRDFRYFAPNIHDFSDEHKEK
jgi:lipopolysaccharide cholinephosphotransferase